MRYRCCQIRDAAEGKPCLRLRRSSEQHGRFPGARTLSLPTDRIPQLRDVNALLGPLTGIQMVPVTGLVSDRAYIIEKGRIRYQGAMAALMEDEAARTQYLSV